MGREILSDEKRRLNVNLFKNVFKINGDIDDIVTKAFTTCDECGVNGLKRSVHNFSDDKSELWLCDECYDNKYHLGQSKEL